MNPPSIDIKDILDAESSIDLTAATNLFVFEMPDHTDTPDLCVCLYDSGGFSPADTLDDERRERPTVQVMVRGAVGGYTTAHNLAQDIRDTLHNLTDYTINSARYIRVAIEGDVNNVGKDDKKRPLLTMNFNIQRTDA